MTDKEIIAEIKELYNSIDLCISDLVKGRTEHNDVQVANAYHKMESLMVQTQQVLSCVSDTFEESTSEDLEEAAEKAVLSVFTGYADLNTPFREEKIALVGRIFKDGANWQKKQMMKDAISGRIDSVSNNSSRLHITAQASAPLTLKTLDRCKVIIIKND